MAGTWIGQGEAPQVSGAMQSGSGSLRVTFNEEMNPNTEFLTPSNYVISGPTTVVVTAVIPENLTDPIFADLTLDSAPTLGTDNYTVTVDSLIKDTAGNVMDPAHQTALFSGWVRDADSPCFEDNLPVPTTLDVRLQNVITGYPYTEQLRKILLKEGNSVGNQQAGARTIFWYAAETNLRTIFAAVQGVDLDDVVDIQLCYRSRMLDMAMRLQRSQNIVRKSAAEIKTIVGNLVFEPVQEYLNSDSPVYRVSAVATLVLLGASA